MSTPAYQEIKDFILARIHAGEWAEGDQVPSENELAREFKVARMTVNRALRELTAEQVLTRIQGRVRSSRGRSTNRRSSRSAASPTKSLRAATGITRACSTSSR
ncbi:hypothetical protein BMMON3_30210 [Burkholderia mallei]